VVHEGNNENDAQNLEIYYFFNAVPMLKTIWDKLMLLGNLNFIPDISGNK